MIRQRVVVESPLKGDTVENFRFTLWCCRYLYDAGYAPIASHTICPWFMDDASAYERKDGIDWPWMWQTDIEHWFFTDRGMSRGMGCSEKACLDQGIVCKILTLEKVSREHYEGFARGERPTHTDGFQMQERSADDDA